MGKILASWFHRYFSKPEAMSIALLLLFGIILVNVLGNVIAPILLSLIVAYLLTSVVKRFENWHCPKLLAVILVFTLFLTVVLLALLWLLPLLWEEMNSLFAALPDMVRRGQKLFLVLQARYPLVISTAKLQQIISSWDLYLASFGKFFWSFSLASLHRVITIIVYVVLVPLLSFFFLKDGAVISKWFAQFLPQKRSILKKIGHEINYKIGSYIKGKILEMLLVFLVTAIIFALMGLQYAILLGALVGVSVLVPYVGIIVVTIPIVVVALLEWGWTYQFLYLMVIYAVIITLDANILVPMLFSEAMDLHPVVIILAVFVFGSLWGFWGVFFAIPLATFADVLLKLWPKAEDR